jgi:cytosine/adenosine deaminase-related metal-dependent hydrolase
VHQGKNNSWTISARWVIPIEGIPLERGIVTIVGDRIAAVVPAGAHKPDHDLGNAAILPGLVNAHTHLDLSGFSHPIPVTGSFTDWLLTVIAHRRTHSPEQVEKHIRAGLAESLAHGVTLLGDISSQGLSWPILSAAPVRAVVFHELLGLSRSRACQSWTTALDWLRRCPATATCRPGLSPHAPYSVRSSLFRAAAALAAERRFPIAIHLAESPAEMDLLQHRQGPFVSFLERLGVWDPEGLVSSCMDLMSLNQGVPHRLFIHGNYLDPPTMPVPAPGSTVVYCPRTHAWFGHPTHPFRDLLARGINVALGTDSRASSPDLDLLAEARFLHERYLDLPGADLLRLATLSGAEALGWAEETGSLVPGKSADLVVVPLPDRDDRDPHELVLESHLPVQRVLLRGQWVVGPDAHP